MNQKVTPHPTHTHIHALVWLRKFISFNIHTAIQRITVVAMLLCAAYAAKAQNLTVTINGYSTHTNQPSLRAAFDAARDAHDIYGSEIVSIEISAGAFQASDWEELHAYSYDALESFIITDDVTSVADMTYDYLSGFYRLKSLSVAKVKNVQTSFDGYLTSVSFPHATNISGCFHCYNLTNVNLPAATYIGKQAFENCSALTSINLPQATTIDSAAFYRCSALSSISLPQATAIGNWAFWGSRISSIDLPKATVIGNNAFCGCPLTSVNLPKATTIGIEAFSYCPLTSINLPLATTIGYEAFFYCTSLTTVNLPQAITVADRAFNSCYSLTNVSLPKATSIGKWVASGSALTYLHLGATPPTLNPEAFDDYPSPRFLTLVDATGKPLTGTALSTAIAKYKAADDGNTADNLWFGWRINEQPEKLTIRINGSSTTHTGSSLEAAIANSGVTIANIKELEVVSGDFLVADAKYLRGINIEKLTLSGNIELLGVHFEHPTVREFSGPNIKGIGESVFEGCNNLTTVNLPSAITIGEDAFWDCPKLTTVHLPNAISIGDCAFEDCISLSSINLPNATTIGEWAFDYCDGLTHVFLPKVTHIGSETFRHCISLTFLYLGPTPPTLEKDYNNRYDNFDDCPSPRFLKLVDADGNPLTGSALSNAIYGQYRPANDGNSSDNLWHGWRINENPVPLNIKVNEATSVTGSSLQAAIAASGIAPNQIRAIEVVGGDFVGADCAYMRGITSLQKFTINTTFDTLRLYLIHPTLREFNGPNIKAVCSLAFYDCDALTNVNLPKATFIGSDAFSLLSKLTNVNLPNAKYIAAEAFRRTSLTDISLPLVTQIGVYAFWGSTLANVSLPKTTSIDAGAFSNCSSLANISLPEATIIGNYAFSSCTTFAHVSLPKATNIGDRAFSECTTLSFIQLGATPPSLETGWNSEYYNFEHCPSPRYLQLVDDAGNPLTGNALATAIAKYKAADDGNTTDNLWHGWTILESAPIITRTGVCPGATYAWQGGNYSAGAHINANGTQMLILWEWPSQKEVYVTYEGSSYTWNDITFTESGSYTYTYTTTSSHGCDSSATLHLDFTYNPNITPATNGDGEGNGEGSEGGSEGSEGNNEGGSTGLLDRQLDALSLSPNPTNGELWIDISTTKQSRHVLVYNVNGYLVRRVPVGEQRRVNINLSQLPSGVYIVRVGNAAAKVVRM